jgi:mono/diheme cytochrome c family protein
MMGRLAVLPLLALALCDTLSSAPLAVYTINDESIARLRKAYPMASAEVDDPVYKRKQRYQGFWLSDVLKELGPAGKFEPGLYLRFRCKDGYLPIMPLSRAQESKALIAIRDLGAPDGKNWQQSPENGTVSTPAPSYLVWVSPPGPPEEYPWPYQMVAIELVTASDALGEGVAGGSPVAPGYDLFVTHCLKCHSINGLGGTMGPELNFPCSVTEYWDPRFLSRFIAHAGSIRAQTKMPDFRAIP